MPTAFVIPFFKQFRSKGIGYGLIIMLVGCLQSCQSPLAIKQERESERQRLHQAATYNMQLGLAYLRQADRPRAKQKLLAALDLDPFSPDTNAAMGYFFEKTGDIEKSRDFYKKALSLAAHDGAQWNNYGAFLCRRGQYKEAEPYFLKAVSDVHYIHTAGAYENAGLCAAAIPDYNKALEYFNKALAADPARKQSLQEIAQIEMKLQHPEKAFEILQQYKQQVVNDAALLTVAINAAHQTGQFTVEKTLKVRLIRIKATPGR